MDENILNIYHNAGFKFFLCKQDKSPDMIDGWKLSKNHITKEKAIEFQKIGRMIGAWIPKNIIVINLDRHKGKPDGFKEFKKIKEKYNVTTDLMDNTFAVRTGGNGLHIFFIVKDKYVEGLKAPGIYLKTNFGYVIAAGSPGYVADNDYKPILIIPKLKKWLDSFESDIKSDTPKITVENDKYFPIKTAYQIFKKLDVKKFSENKRWAELVRSAAATFGNNSEIHKMLNAWSNQDKDYEGNRDVYKTLKNNPVSDLTVGTFIFILREEDISNWYINKLIRRDTISNLLIECEIAEIEIPFEEPNYNDIAKTTEAKDFFNMQGNTSAAAVIEMAVFEKVIYSRGEKKAFYFDGNRWVELTNHYGVIYTILFRVSKIIYSTEDGKEIDEDSRFTKVAAAINNKGWKDYVWAEVVVKDRISIKSIDWDSSEIRETITTIDGVIDFSNGALEVRNGLREEFRQSFIDYKNDEIINGGNPKYFKDFMSTIFPDSETLQTAIYSICLCISGNANKRHFHIWEGSGANGKSTLIGILLSVLGRDKSMSYTPKIILENKFDNIGNTPELAAFRGKYAAFGIETDSGKKFSTAMIKNLTGGDTIPATPKYSAPIIFESTWQLILAVNDLPNFNADDKAFITRLLILPFIMKFYKNEKEKLELLKSGAEEKYIKKIIDRDSINKPILNEKPAIINYLIKKYIELQTKLNGIVPESSQCQLKKNTYIKDNDDMGIFLTDMCFVENDKDYFSVTEEIADAYREFVGSKKLSTKGILNLLKKYDARIDKITKRISIDGKKKQVRGLVNIVLKEKFEEENKFDPPTNDNLFEDEGQPPY